MLVRLLSLLGLIGFWLSWRRHTNCQRAVGLFSVILACGFTALMSLVEVQGRYWLTVCPFYFLLIPYVGSLFGEEGVFGRVWKAVKNRPMYGRARDRVLALSGAFWRTLRKRRAQEDGHKSEGAE